MSRGHPLMTACGVTLDCADPLALAEFYAAATGLPAADGSDGDFAGLRGLDGFFLGFQRVDDYQPPVWPGQTQPQQMHMDFAVADLDEAEAALLLLGAGRPAQQPESATFRVLLDPAGHPFCLTTPRRETGTNGG